MTQLAVVVKEPATPERLAKVPPEAIETAVTVDPSAVSRGAPISVQRLHSAPLDRLWKTGWITQREYDAGDSLRAKAYLAAIDPGAMTVDWSATGGGSSRRIPSMFSSQEVADARLHIRWLRELIGGVVWDILNLGVILERELDVLGRNIFGVRDAREAAVAARAGVRVALGSLADVYERRA